MKKKIQKNGNNKVDVITYYYPFFLLTNNPKQS